jgi:hypothetical protein
MYSACRCGVSRYSATSKRVVFTTSILQRSRQGSRALDIALLPAFVATAQQHNDDLAAPNTIDAIARPVIDAHFEQTLAEGFQIARIALLHAPDPPAYARNGLIVSQPCQPGAKFICLADHNHEQIAL